MRYITVEVENYIATVVYSNPPVNATGYDAYMELRDTFYDLDQRNDVKVVILTGAGKTFMAGNNLNEFPEFMERGKCTSYYDFIRNAYLSVQRCKYPTIAAVNGAAAGAGFAFAGVCDVVIAAEEAKFALSEIKVGIIGADGFASLMLPEKLLRYMAFSGSMVSARDIAAYGGIHKVVPKAELMDTARNVASEFAANARTALIQWKKCLNMNYDHDLTRKFENDLACTVEYQPYDDFKEASKAFLEKRMPVYNNR